MRIGIVRKGYSATGGAEAYLFRFADAARAAGHTTVLISGNEWPPDVWRHEQVRIAGKSPQDFADLLAGRRESAEWDALFSLERIWACHVYRAGDGVHAAWLDRRRQSEPAWRSWFRSLQRKHREILELECALFTGGAQRIIANSRMVKEEIVSHFGTPGEHVHVIHNGVSIAPADHGMRERTRKELQIAPERFVALFAGTGWPRKGLRDAIAAVNALKTPVTLLIAGGGNPRSQESSDRVRFLGPLDASRVRTMFSAADVFILPTYYDPFSNACLEALAAGLPVITTTANGFSEIIEPGVEGEAVTPGDVAALEVALSGWTDPVRRESVRPRLLATAAKYSVEENLARTLEAITGVVASAANPPG
jgi:UDP-glucose:(heptosyl)LPS alpha-1,3-glucosyltransferase